MKFQARITAGNVAMLCMFLVVSIYVFSVLKDFERIDSAQTKTVDLIQATGRLESIMHEMEASVRNYMLTGKEEYLTPYKTLQEEFNSQTQKAIGIGTAIDMETSPLTKAQALMQDWYKQEAEPSIMDRKRLDMTPAERAKQAGKSASVKVDQVLDIGFLREFQRLFTNMSGIANVVVEKDGTPVKQQSFDEFSSFCFGLIRPTKEGAARCQKNDSQGGKQAMETGKPSVYTCHAGLVDFAVPIIVDGVQIGSWLGGQVLTEQPDLERFRQIATELNIDQADMYAAVQQIPVLKPEHVQSAADFLQLVANSQSQVGNTNLMWDKVIARLDSGVGQQILQNAGQEIALFVTSLKEVRMQDQADMSASLRNLRMLLWVGLAIFLGVTVLVLTINKKTIGTQIGGDPKAIAEIANRIASGDDTLRFDGEDKAQGIYLAIIKLHRQLQKTFADMKAEHENAKQRAQAAQEAKTEADNARREAEQAKRDGMLAAADTVEDIVLRVSSAAQELSRQVDEAAKGAAAQQEHATGTAVAMNEMNATVAEVARNASAAASDAENAREKATSGNNTVIEVESVIKAINTQFGIQEQELNGLSEQVSGIESIMNVISDIADQTNLLALNAAIEAARAGDAGRGFAVVADEVRKLAEKTMHATSEVTTAVTAITEATAKNVNHMHLTRQEVEKSISMATTAREVLQDIVSISDQNFSQAQNIATASEQQAQSSEEISQSIELVNTTSQQTASAMSEATQAVAELAKLSVELENLVVEMKSA
ncbi:MAG: PocR ligand-binding domain-containing protein [Desulfovibrio sp.]|uniref:PocR ligand-binding domain-containing protein n=1 Tax=Desulfovibrio sp. 7SRBS1 TaxID=3378064 RepID=UPI003B401B31